MPRREKGEAIPEASADKQQIFELLRIPISTPLVKAAVYIRTAKTAAGQQLFVAVDFLVSMGLANTDTLGSKIRRHVDQRNYYMVQGFSTTTRRPGTSRVIALTAQGVKQFLSPSIWRDRFMAALLYKGFQTATGLAVATRQRERTRRSTHNTRSIVPCAPTGDISAACTPSEAWPQNGLLQLLAVA